eukprot:gene7268-380_t
MAALEPAAPQVASGSSAMPVIETDPTNIVPVPLFGQPMQTRRAADLAAFNATLEGEVAHLLQAQGVAKAHFEMEMARMQSMVDTLEAEVVSGALVTLQDMPANGSCAGLLSAHGWARAPGRRAVERARKLSRAESLLRLQSPDCGSMLGLRNVVATLEMQAQETKATRKDNKRGATGARFSSRTRPYYVTVRVGVRLNFRPSQVPKHCELLERNLCSCSNS